MKAIWDWLLGRTHTSDCQPAAVGLLVTRVSIGLMMAFGHGWGKLMMLGDTPIKFADPFGLGMTISLVLTVFAEFFCALAVAVGLFTRGALIPLAVTMATAAFVILGDDPFGRKEKAILYLVIFVALLITGPGKYSLDRMLKRK